METLEIRKEHLMSAKEIAKYFNLSYSTVLRWIDRGYIKDVTGRDVFRQFAKADVIQFANSIKQNPPKGKKDIALQTYVKSLTLKANGSIKQFLDLPYSNGYTKVTPISKREISISENTEGIVTITLK